MTHSWQAIPSSVVCGGWVWPSTAEMAREQRRKENMVTD